MTYSVVLREMLGLADELPLNEIPAIVRQLDAAERLYFYGVGRCGLVVRMFAMRLMHLGYTCHIVGDVTSPAARAQDLLLAASGSGMTATTVQIAGTAAGLGMPVLLFTNNLAAPLAQSASHTVYIPGVHKQAKIFTSQQPTGSLFEQMLLCFFEETICYLMRVRQLEGTALMVHHANLE
ncbi:MAG: 6-phospho-3-hexuloisomerase [Aggregatilineales bacterium]